MSANEIKRIANDLKVVTFQEDEEKLYHKACCDEASFTECLTRCYIPFIRIFLRAGVIKFLLSLIQTRSFSKLMGAFRYEIPRFGATFGATAALFHLLLCVLRRLRKKGHKYFMNMTDQLACMIAAFISVLPLIVGLQQSELNLVKLLFFPLVFRCLCDKMMEIGMVTPFKHSDILAYMFTGFFVSYTYMVEHASCPKSTFKLIDTYSRMNVFENRTYNTASTLKQIANAQKYPKYKFPF